MNSVHQSVVHWVCVSALPIKTNKSRNYVMMIYFYFYFVNFVDQLIRTINHRFDDLK